MGISFLSFVFLLGSQGSHIDAKYSWERDSCDISDDDSDIPRGVYHGYKWQDGCLMKRCDDGNIIEERIAEECLELIEDAVEEELAERGLLDCSTDTDTDKGPEYIMKTEYEKDPEIENPGILVVGGFTKVQLFKPNTNQVCDLPDTPRYFGDSSMDLIDGTPIVCGSIFGSPSKSRMKNETELREFYPVKSCVQLSPASREAEWTIYANIRLKRYHQSLPTSEGILLIGGYDGTDVSLVKPDGSSQEGIFQLKRQIDGGCGIIDEDTIIITGGGADGSNEPVGSKTVDRYNKEGYLQSLPEMSEARAEHGCGYFIREGKKVLVVAGGYATRKYLSGTAYIPPQFDSTEMLVLGTDAWVKAAPLPKKLRTLSYVSLNNKIFFSTQTRDHGIGSVYEFDGRNWTETFKARESSTFSSKAAVLDLATSGFNEFCN